MRIAYFDCFSGISGDVCLGALLANGVSQDELVAGLQGLGLEDWEIRQQEVKQHGITATDIEVRVSGNQPHRHLSDILDLIDKGSLPGHVKEQAKCCLT